MSVHVIDTIKPKNGLNFPVVEAEDVACGSARLSDIVATMATQADIEALQSAINGKASQSDLEALQATVEDKADAADLTALEAEVDAKADSSALTTAAANLQAQIDELITPVTQDAEVQNARVGADGTTYNTLKARLDAENAQVNDDLNNFPYLLRYLSKGVIAYNGGVGALNNDANADKEAIYYNSSSSSVNYKTLMAYNYAGETWEIIHSLNYDDLTDSFKSGICDNSEFILFYDRIIANGVLPYAGGIGAISQDGTVDRNIVYYNSTSSASYKKLMAYSTRASKWVTIAGINYDDLSAIIKNGLIYDTNPALFIDRIASYGVQPYEGGLGVISQDASADRDVVYYNSLTTSPNYKKLMAYSTRTSAWINITGIDYDDLSDGVKNGFAYNSNSIILTDRIIAYGLKAYPGGIGAISQDGTVSKKYVYYNSLTSSVNYKKIMAYSDTEDKWVLMLGVDYDDFSEMSQLGINDYIDVDPTPHEDVSAEVKTALNTVMFKNVNGRYLNIAFITDTHANAYDATNYVRYFEQLTNEKLIDIGVHGGDVITSRDMTYNNYSIALLNSLRDYKNTVFCKGNHEDNYYMSGDTTQVTNYQLANMFNNEKAYDFVSPGTGYGYIDFPIYGIRVIILNAFSSEVDKGINVDYGSAQTSWFANVAMNLPTGYKAILFGHFYSSEFISGIQDTSDIIAYVHGHNHADQSTTINGINVIGCNWGCDSERDSKYGSVNIITIDTDLNKLFITEIGAGSDREFAFGSQE